MVVAHRGHSGALPENTLEAYADALRCGAVMVELDTRDTRDGIPVCIHDATLLADSSGTKLAVANLSLAQLRQVPAGASIPTLEEALNTIQPGAITMIERKAGSAASLLQLLTRMELLDEVLVQSFDWDWLDEIHALQPRLTLGAMGDEKAPCEVTPSYLRRLESIKAAMVHWHHLGLAKKAIQHLRAQGYLTCAYTANSDAEMGRLLDFGIDAITTNHPLRLNELMQAD